MRLFLSALLCAAALGLSACAKYAPVPGGGDSKNDKYYASEDDFRTRVNQITPGMGESQVLSILGRSRDDLTLLSREQVVATLYGGGAVQQMNSAHEREQTRLFLQSLYGYRLDYRDVQRHHGFSSPIRVRSQSEGFSYSVTLIFQNGILVERPVLAGGMVNEATSRTFFDYLNPGMAMDYVR